MQVAQYTFQSPSASPVQVGKLDPSSVKEEVQEKEVEKTPASASESSSVNSNQLLDIYA